MTNVIIAFSKIEDARSIKGVLLKNGFNVVAVCSSGAYAINMAENFDNGIVICGYKLADMMYTELNECLPRGFKVLLVASERHWMECEGTDVVFVATPLKVHTLIEALQMVVETTYKKSNKKAVPTKRSEKELETVAEAKKMLMEKHAMSEEEAYRYIRKCSMDSGNSLVETAQKVISIYG